jgi:hypothetical protein
MEYCGFIAPYKQLRDPNQQISPDPVGAGCGNPLSVQSFMTPYLLGHFFPYIDYVSYIY